MPTNDIFQHFKKPQQVRTALHKKADEIYFKIGFDDYGAYLEVVDKKANPIQVSYEDYAGTERALLKSLEAIEERTAFVIDWQKQESRVYLQEHEHLMWQLKELPNLIDGDKNLLTFRVEKLKYTLKIEPDEKGNYRSKLLLQGVKREIEEFKPIVEDFVLSGNTIYETWPVGPNFAQAHYFNGTFATEDLPRYFSLLYSYLLEINVEFEGYSTHYSDERVSPRPAIIIEKIDADDALYMQVSQVLPSLGMDFYAQFRPEKIASVNELEKSLLSGK